jgi:C4-dicarboxylate transporter DctM subunit
MILGAIMFTLVLAGSIMESISITIILAPIVAPIAQSIGIHPVHFALIFIVGLSLGFVTPPFGLDLFVASGITGIPYDRLIRWVPPYLVGIILAWLVVAAVPWLSLVFI